MVEFLKSSFLLFFKSGVYISVLVVLVLLIGQAFGRFMPPYVIVVSAYRDGTGELKCNAEKLNLIKEEIRVASYKYIERANSLKVKEYLDSTEIVTNEEDNSILKTLFDGNKLYAMISEAKGYTDRKIQIFINMADGDCTAKSAVLIHKNERRFIPISSGSDFEPIAQEVVNAVDDFIPTVVLARDYKTTAEARRRSFVAISQGKQVKWYMNLVAFTYLEEASIFDRNANADIVLGRFDRASYWIDRALAVDRNFLPAIFNKIYVDIERNKHVSDAYDRSISSLMNMHYRIDCGECLSRIARLRLERFERMEMARKTYSQRDKDISQARDILEYKINRYGATAEDTVHLYRAVQHIERGEYFEYLHYATGRGGSRSVTGR